MKSQEILINVLLCSALLFPSLLFLFLFFIILLLKYEHNKHSYGLENEMATLSSILAWEISWTEEPGGVQSMGSQKGQTRLSD